MIGFQTYNLGQSDGRIIHFVREKSRVSLLFKLNLQSRVNQVE